MKKITVLLPVYEVTGRTCKCIDSILNQTEKGIEVICLCFNKFVEEQINKLEYGERITLREVETLENIFENVNSIYVTIVN